MRCKGLSIFKNLQVIAIAIFFAQGCGQALQGTSTPCGSGTAQIDVYDNFLLRGCGCAEGSGATFTVGQNLVCTVPVGTKIFFYYPKIVNQHFIVMGPGATGSPLVHDPRSGALTNPVDAITLNSTSAGITFIDQYTGNGGTFVVQ